MAICTLLQIQTQDSHHQSTAERNLKLRDKLDFYSIFNGLLMLRRNPDKDQVILGDQVEPRRIPFPGTSDMLTI